MSDNVQNITVEILRGIQESVSLLRTEVLPRLDRLDAQIRKVRRDHLGTLLITRSAAGDLTERMNTLEERMAAVEARRQPT